MSRMAADVMHTAVTHGCMRWQGAGARATVCSSPYLGRLCALGVRRRREGAVQQLRARGAWGYTKAWRQPQKQGAPQGAANPACWLALAATRIHVRHE